MCLSCGYSTLISPESNDPLQLVWVPQDFLKLKGGKWNSNLKSWIFPGSKKARKSLSAYGLIYYRITIGC